MMDWQQQLITIYLYVCKHYLTRLWIYTQRMTNKEALLTHYFDNT